MTDNLTFETICAIEPQLKDFYLVAKENKLQVDQQYLWENLLSVQIVHLIGPGSKTPLLQTAEAHRIIFSKVFRKRSD